MLSARIWSVAVVDPLLAAFGLAEGASFVLEAFLGLRGVLHANRINVERPLIGLGVEKEHVMAATPAPRRDATAPVVPDDLVLEVAVLEDFIDQAFQIVAGVP